MTTFMTIVVIILGVGIILALGVLIGLAIAISKLEEMESEERE